MKSLDVESKRIHVTGAAGGIGSAASYLLAERGAHLVLSDIDGRAVAELAKEIGGPASAICCDVRSAAQVRAAINATQQRLGGLDVLICNAGIQPAGQLSMASEDDFDQAFATNLKGAWLMAREAIPLLVAAGGGAIINVGSVAGLGGTPGAGVYAASKAALINLTQTLALELRASGIRVSAVLPGVIDTPMHRRFHEKLQHRSGTKPTPLSNDGLLASKQARLGTPQEVAEVIAFLASDAAIFISGTGLVVDNAMSASIV